MELLIIFYQIPRQNIYGDEGLKDMKVIDAIYKAVKSGKEEAIDFNFYTSYLLRIFFDESKDE